jgi:hypothetical protein
MLTVSSSSDTWSLRATGLFSVTVNLLPASDVWMQMKQTVAPPHNVTPGCSVLLFIDVIRSNGALERQFLRGEIWLS